MIFDSLFLELKKLNLFEVVNVKVEGVNTVIILRNVQSDECLKVVFPNVQARLFLRIIGLLNDYKSDMIEEEVDG